MFKMPEPALVNEIRYSGIAVNKFVSENLYTEAQLKQAVREALEEAALLFNQPHKEYFGQEIQDEIRKLKEGL